MVLSPPPGQLLARMRRRLVSSAWRLVEGQHLIATRQLVDTPAEHQVLEEMLESSKPALLPGTKHLHYLLATSFRYPPLRHGSRLGTRRERGIWFGSEAPATAMAEVAWYRLCFLADTRAELAGTHTEHTLFRAKVDARPGIDLMVTELRRWRRALTDPSSWTMGQTIGGRLRELDVRACRLASARDVGGINIAVLSPTAFAAPVPDASSLQTWHCDATNERVVFTRRGALALEQCEYARERFLVHGKLPRPGA